MSAVRIPNFNPSSNDLDVAKIKRGAIVANPGVSIITSTYLLFIIKRLERFKDQTWSNCHQPRRCKSSQIISIVRDMWLFHRSGRFAVAAICSISSPGINSSKQVSDSNINLSQFHPGEIGNIINHLGNVINGRHH